MRQWSWCGGQRRRFPSILLSTIPSTPIQLVLALVVVVVVVAELMWVIAPTQGAGKSWLLHLSPHEACHLEVDVYAQQQPQPRPQHQQHMQS